MHQIRRMLRSKSEQKTVEVLTKDWVTVASIDLHQLVPFKAHLLNGALRNKSEKQLFLEKENNSITLETNNKTNLYQHTMPLVGVT